MKQAAKSIMPAFSALCLGAALSLCAARATLGLSDANNNSVQFESEKFRASPYIAAPTPDAALSVSFGGNPLVFGDLQAIGFSTDSAGAASFKMAVSGPKDAASNLTVLHAMGKNIAISERSVSLSGLKPNAYYFVDAGVVDYYYTAEDALRDPEHKLVERRVFWNPSPRNMTCAPSCAFFIAAPRLAAIGPQASVERNLSYTLGQTSSGSLFLGAFGAMLALGAARLGARQIAHAAAPAIGPLRVKI